MGLGDWARRATTVPGTNAAKNASKKAGEASEQAQGIGKELKEQAYTQNANSREDFNNAQGALSIQREELMGIQRDFENVSPERSAAAQSQATEHQDAKKAFRFGYKDASLAGRTDMDPAAKMQAAQLGPSASSRDVQLAQALQSQAAQLGPQQKAQAAQLGQANQISALNPMQAAQGQAAQYGPAATVNGGQSSQQQQLLNALSERATGGGPSIADLTAQQARESSIQQQMAMMASSRGDVNAGLAQRQAAQNLSSTNQSISRDLMLAKTKEQLEAQGLAAQALGQARGQDIQLGSTQASLEQQRMMAQGGANQAMNLQNLAAQNSAMQQNQQLSLQQQMANQQAANQFGLQQGQFNQAAGMFDAQTAANMNQQQAQMQQQTNLANQQQGNQFGLQQGQLDLQRALADQQYQNQYGLQQGQMNQQAAMSNQDALNSFASQQASLDQQTRLSNQDAINTRMAQTENHAVNLNLADQQAANSMQQFYAGLDANRYESDAARTQQANLFNAQTQNNFDVNKVGILQGLSNARTNTSLQEYDIQRTRNLDLQNALTNSANVSLGAAGSFANAGQTAMLPGQAQMQFMGNILQAGGTMGAAGIGAAVAASDPVTKTNMSSPTSSNEKLLSALKKSKEYNYIDEKYGDTDKRYFGPMSTDLPDSLTKDIGGVRMVDTGRFALSLGSVVGQQQDEIEKLKAALKAQGGK